MNMQQLHYFKKIAEMEHYTKAANALSITQPCLSYAISELEKELGAPLFYKTGRNIKLTRYGDMFLIHVKNALGALDMGKSRNSRIGQPQQRQYHYFPYQFYEYDLYTLSDQKIL